MIDGWSFKLTACTALGLARQRDLTDPVLFLLWRESRRRRTRDYLPFSGGPGGPAPVPSVEGPSTIEFPPAEALRAVGVAPRLCPHRSRSIT